MAKQFIIPADGQQFEADWPTHFDMPADGGKLEGKKLDTRFVQLSPEDKDEFFKDAIDEVVELTGEDGASVRRLGPIMALILAPETALKFLLKVIKDIKGLKQLDADGKPQDVSYSESRLEALCRQEYIKTALIRSYFSFHTGVVEKN